MVSYGASEVHISLQWITVELPFQCDVVMHRLRFEAHLDDTELALVNNLSMG